MRIMTLTRLVGALVLAGVGLVTTACNTSKATVDTFAKFTSSTSPGEMFDADGYVKQSQKARLFAAAAFENLEQDIARGNGEYLASLGLLLDIPAAEQEEFRTRAQSAYPFLFASNRRTAEGLLAMLARQRADDRTDRQ
jgi:hypothetical protein